MLTLKSPWGPVILLLAVAALCGGTGRAAPDPAQDPEQQAEEYAWSDSCRKCHQEIHEAWAKTKHARAFDRLSESDKRGPCAGCHLTGAKTPLRRGSTVVNAGIQCESCHGAAAAHVGDPAVKSGLVRKPDEKVCTGCHNDRSPHFKGFFYGAMARYSHYVR